MQDCGQKTGTGQVIYKLNVRDKNRDKTRKQKQDQKQTDTMQNQAWHQTRGNAKKGKYFTQNECPKSL